jgi:putative Holliday junction resolvase
MDVTLKAMSIFLFREKLEEMDATSKVGPIFFFMGRILGLDVGDKTIGIAVSDELGWTAQGVTTLKRENKKKDIEAIARLVKTYSAEKVVVGFPKNMNNSLGEQAEKVLKFAKSLERQLDKIPITLWDERLSTSMANNVLISADLSRKKRKRVVNTLAAVVILQGYLDAQSL